MRGIWQKIYIPALAGFAQFLSLQGQLQTRVIIAIRHLEKRTI
jgi:hypothetical protein